MSTRLQQSLPVRKVIAFYRTADTKAALINLISASTVYLGALSSIIVCLTMETRALQLTVVFVGYFVCGLAIVKVFAIQHDCGHDSYFRCSRWNRGVGRICSIITLVPFTAWK